MSMTATDAATAAASTGRPEIVLKSSEFRKGRAEGWLELERLVTSVPCLDGLVLRYGQLYGPGTWNAAPSGNVPVHLEAAARAAALAVTRGEPGIYNIVEDGAAASNAKARAGLGWDPGLR